MENQPSASGQPRRNKRVLVALAILGSVILAALVAGLAYLMFSGHNMAGLEGTWRDMQNPKHIYEFQPSGNVDTWTGSKSWWNRIGWSATWRRDGQQITIRTDRNWDLVGELDGGMIRGKMIMRDPTGETVTTADTVWQKD